MMEIKHSRITLIGTGRLAYTLAYHLIKNGFNIVKVLSRTESSVNEFSQKFKIKSFDIFNGQIPEASDVIFIAVSDQAIESAAKKIASANKSLKGKTFIHFSGALNSTVLDTLKKKKALTGSFHIMQTFPSKKRVNIRNSYAAVEAADEGLVFSLFNFAKLLKLRPFRITPESKSYYHMTGVFTSNFLIPHFYNSEKLYKSSKIESVPYFNLFRNIIDETIRNIKTDGLKNSISGPVIRGDVTTIKDHISLLKKKKEWLLLINYLTESLTLLEILKDEKQSKENLLLQNYLKKELKAASKII